MTSSGLLRMSQGVFHTCMRHEDLTKKASQAAEQLAEAQAAVIVKHGPRKPIYSEDEGPQLEARLLAMNTEIMPLFENAHQLARNARAHVSNVTEARDAFATSLDKLILDPSEILSDSMRRQLVARLAEIDQRLAATAELQEQADKRLQAIGSKL